MLLTAINVAIHSDMDIDWDDVLTSSEAADVPHGPDEIAVLVTPQSQLAVRKAALLPKRLPKVPTWSLDLPCPQQQPRDQRFLASPHEKGKSMQADSGS